MKLINGIRSLLYFKVPKFFSAINNLRSVSTVKARGLRFNLISDNWITKFRARTFNEKEPKMLDWLDNNLRSNDVFFDIGANVGIYSVYAAKREPQSMVYAFEPEYSNLHLLKQNIINNNLLDNVICYSIALKNETGISYLHI